MQAIAGGKMMERLTIQEIIEHCKRKTEYYEKKFNEEFLYREPLTNLSKEYWEHRQVAAYLEELLKYRELMEQECSINWIPAEEQLPEPDRYILVSFENFSIPMVGRYDATDDESGVFRIGDKDDSFLQHDLYVNAWMYLPECYKESQVAL